MTRKDRFIQAFNTYIQRNGENLKKQEIEPLIMNLAYLEVIKAKKSGQYIESMKVLVDYSNSANELIPGLNFQPEIVSLGYQATISWDGLWSFLIDYFSSKLGWNIDEKEVVYESFHSSCHSRYESNYLVSKSQVNRRIDFILTEDKCSILVRISESLSDKKAILDGVYGNRKVYKGSDPDYLFTIVYDSFGSIEEFVLEIVPRNLRIIYHE
jgi:hypothetical protein